MGLQTAFAQLTYAHALPVACCVHSLAQHQTHRTRHMREVCTVELRTDTLVKCSAREWERTCGPIVTELRSVRIKGTRLSIDADERGILSPELRSHPASLCSREHKAVNRHACRFDTCTCTAHSGKGQGPHTVFWRSMAGFDLSKQRAPARPSAHTSWMSRVSDALSDVRMPRRQNS